MELFTDICRMFDMPKPRIEPELHTGKRAAVMLPLCHVKGEPAVLFTLRSQNVGTHKGQVSFPGGHLDLNDECMEGCAQRECEV
jgi:8-oxo-dGTP pyrophosphatase MutT (NUDIX family)